MSLYIRKLSEEDLPKSESIRAIAFAPIFGSFRKILGDEIYETAQKSEDDKQSELLAGMFLDTSEWTLFVAEWNGEVMGFVSVYIDTATKVGEIGLNAIEPKFAGKGHGTQMFDYALEYMKSREMRVATVATGGDPSHLAARKAYEKAGFDVQIPSVWYCRTL
ncbi:MAG: GNAT family N-acetyltransferase [Burkholderiaceae bacterium]